MNTNHFTGFLRAQKHQCVVATGSLNRSLQFHKRSQFFIGSHDETLSVAMCSEKTLCYDTEFCCGYTLTRYDPN